MEIRKLRHASVLARELSFSKAANKLSLSQSALSKSIAALETELGVTLFERHAAGVSMTAVGKEFVIGANKLLQQASALYYDMSLLSQGERGKVIFGMGSLPAAAYETKLLLELLNTHPEVGVQIEVATPSDLLVHLANQRIEFFVGDARSLSINSDFSIKTLLTLQVGFFVNPKHSILKRKHVKLRDVYKFPIVGAPIDREQLDDALVENWLGNSDDPKFNMHLSSENVASLKSVTRQSDVVLIAPLSVVCDELMANDLCLVPIKEKAETLVINLDLVMLSKRQLSASAQKVIELIKSIAGDVEGELVQSAKNTD